ncbi:MAG: DUF6629 family protein [Rhodanobacter sp.]
MLYAQRLLTLLIPLSVWLIEPDQRRRRLVLPFLALGAVLTAYMLWALVSYLTAIYVQEHSVVCSNPAGSHVWLAVLYVVATCGTLFFSGYRYIMVLGAVNLVGVLLTIWLKHYAFTPVWCAYAAVVSVLVYFHFSRRCHALRRGRVLVH